MKNIFLFTTIFLCSFTLSGQHYFGPSVFAGMGKYIRVESKFGPDQLYKPLFVAGIGFNYEYQLNKKSRIVTGLNFHAKGEKLSHEWQELTFPDMINPFYGFVKPTNAIPPSDSKLIVRYYSLMFQVPLMYQYRFQSGDNNSWLFAVGASANFVTSSYSSGNTTEGFYNTTSPLREYGNSFIPGALLNVGFSQALKKQRALVYSIVYDQHLDTFYPGNNFYTDWNFNLGVSVSYLFYGGK